MTVEGARRDYGVALVGNVEAGELRVDTAETERLRAGLRAEAVG